MNNGPQELRYRNLVRISDERKTTPHIIPETAPFEGRGDVAKKQMATRKSHQTDENSYKGSGRENTVKCHDFDRS